MKKYRKVLTLGIIILLIPILGLCEEKELEKNISLSILEDMGGKFSEADISGGNKIYDIFLEKKGLESLGEEIRNDIGLLGKKEEKSKYDFNFEPSNYSEKIVDDDDFKQLTIWGINSEGYPTTAVITSYKDKSGNIGETTLYINFVIKEKFDEVNDIIYKVENVFKEFDKKVEINTCIVGTLDGKLTKVEKEKSVSVATKNVNGKVVEKFIDDGIISIIAYTPYVDEYVYVEDKKVNLNIAMRYNELEESTYLWIGTPVITISY